MGDALLLRLARRQQERAQEEARETAACEMGSRLVAWSADPEEWLQTLEQRIVQDLQRSPSRWSWIRPAASTSDIDEFESVTDRASDPSLQRLGTSSSSDSILDCMKSGEEMGSVISNG